MYDMTSFACDAWIRYTPDSWVYVARGHPASKHERVMEAFAQDV